MQNEENLIKKIQNQASEPIKNYDEELLNLIFENFMAENFSTAEEFLNN